VAWSAAGEEEAEETGRLTEDAEGLHTTNEATVTLEAALKRGAGVGSEMNAKGETDTPIQTYAAISETTAKEEEIENSFAPRWRLVPRLLLRRTPTKIRKFHLLPWPLQRPRSALCPTALPALETAPPFPLVLAKHPQQPQGLSAIGPCPLVMLGVKSPPAQPLDRQSRGITTRVRLSPSALAHIHSLAPRASNGSILT
jgi:hypothetical protein